MKFPCRIAPRSPRRTCWSALVGVVAAAAVAGAALAQTPSASQLAAAKEVVVASGVTRSFDIFVPQIMIQIKETVTRTRPEYADDLDAVLKQLGPEFMAFNTQMVDQAAQVFAKNMTEAELKDTAAFFSSPSGKKYIASQPAILDELVGDVQAWTKRISIQMMDRVRAEMKKKGHIL
jgi:hypothetical protein